MRLRRMRDCQNEKRSSEIEEERETRLCQMRIYLNERRSRESVEERLVRLQDDRHRHRQQRRLQQQLLLFEQPSAQEKIRAFYRDLTNLEITYCTTCSEGFPGLTLQSDTTECLRCSRDRHEPKLFSSANNMDPGPLPIQLQVGDM